MGLLDGVLGVTDPREQEVLRNTILAASLGMLSGRGKNFGEIFGNAGMQGMNAGMLTRESQRRSAEEARRQMIAEQEMGLRQQEFGLRSKQFDAEFAAKEDARKRSEALRAALTGAIASTDPIGQFAAAPDDPNAIPDFARGVEQQTGAYNAGMPQLVLSAYMQHAPEVVAPEFLKQAMSGPAKPTISKPGDIARNDRGEIVWQNPAEDKPEAAPEIIKLMRARGIDPASPQGQQILDAFIGDKTAPKPPSLVHAGGGGNVQIDYRVDPSGKIPGPRHPNNPDLVEIGRRQAVSDVKVAPTMNMVQETEQAKTYGKTFGEMRGTLASDAMKAQSKLARLDRMETLLQGIETGKLTPTMTEIEGIAASFGLPVSKNLAPRQAAIALANELALEARSPAGGAGMPGALSDQDRQFLLQMTPNLSQTSEGRKLIIDTQRKLAKRTMDVARMAREYAKSNNGSLDDGFYDVLERFSSANPLFPAQPAAPAAANPAGPFPGFSIQRVQ